MNKILERKIEWMFDLLVFKLDDKPLDDKTRDVFVDRASRIIADETVDEEIKKQELREKTKDTLSKDPLGEFREDTL